MSGIAAADSTIGESRAGAAAVNEGKRYEKNF